MDISSVGTANIQGLNLASMDIETALMMVQSKRAELLESGLKNQIQEIQNRNQSITKLNDALAAAQTLISQEDKGKKGDKQNGDCSGNAAKNDTVNKALSEAGLSDQGWGIFAGGTKRSDVDTLINKIKSAIDSQNNSNQMDMLRLQSLTNKRNEAFDVMTNFIKKMQDSRSSIIGNMR